MSPVERITLGFLASAEARAFMAATMPPLADLQHEPHLYDIATLRQGEWTAAMLALSIGSAVSLIAKDPLPLIMTTITLVGMITAYEHAIRNPGTPKQSIGASIG